jgi:hypothetical protein
LKIFTVVRRYEAVEGTIDLLLGATQLFGWDLDSLWENINQRRCDAFLLAGRVIEAVESFQCMMNIIHEAGKGSCIEWSTSKWSGYNKPNIDTHNSAN